MNLPSFIRPALRLATTISGEAAQSGLHFALGLVLIRLLPARDYGAFAFTLLIGGIGITYIRTLSAMPASIYIGRSPGKRTARFYESMFGGVALALSVMIALIAAVIIGGWIPGASLAAAVFVGLWCLRSHLRTVHFAFGRNNVVSFGDFVFVIVGAIVAALVLWRSDSRLSGVLLALGLANLLGVAAMSWYAGQPLGATMNRRARNVYSRMGPRLGWSAFSVTTANLQGQGISLLVAGTAGPAAYAPIAAALLIFVPLRVIATALVNVFQPEMSGLAARADALAIRRISRNWTIGLGVVSLIYGLFAIALLPFVQARSLDGAPIYLLCFFAWSITTLSILYSAPRALLEVLLKFRSVALITATAALVAMGVIAIMLKWAPVTWAMIGAALGEGVVLVAAWAVAVRELREMSASKSGGRGDGRWRSESTPRPRPQR